MPDQNDIDDYGTLLPEEDPRDFDLLAYIESQRDWSQQTFGPGMRTEGVCTHIEKEVDEIRFSPTDIYEWVDVMILALDGAWRAGYDPDDIVGALEEKQLQNMRREWPEPGPQDQPNEHIRTHAEEAADADCWFGQHKPTQ